ncbi:putative trypsin-6 [Drosophila tropicalis]|uniref:putative trypsin-6 n=1 Tax=Drosophila tropicalis TaxID=46794 RepID=UPI0035ABF78E
MFSLKFVVSFISLSLLVINTISVQWNNTDTDNRTDGEAYDNNDVNNGTDMYLVKSTSLTDYRTLDERQGKQSDTVDDDFEFLITGGFRPTTNPLVQYLVSLRTASPFKYFGDNHFCAGSIISKKAILTAAHCLDVEVTGVKPAKIKVVAGITRRLLKTENAQILNVEKWIVHPEYERVAIDNDIAILKLKDGLKLNDGFVNIIPIADSPRNIGTKCYILGWGRISSLGPIPDEFITAIMTIREESGCRDEDGKALPKGAICASTENDFEVSICEGDSGGPMFCNNKLVGVVSASRIWGQSKAPSVFADVYKFREWIAENAAASLRRSSSIVTIDKLMLLLLAIIKLAITL